MKSLVSIIITTFNRPLYLLRAIESVLNQTYEFIELIVVDDNGAGSILQKETEKIINDIDKSTFGINYIVNEFNQGGSLSRNIGVKYSNGEFIAFLDDDDEFFPTKIAEQILLFKKSKFKKLALVYCFTKRIKPNGKAGKTYKYSFKGNCIYEGMKRCIAATSQWLCKKEFFLKVGGFSDVPSQQDWNLILKLLFAGYELDRVPKVLSLYHSHAGDRISNNGVKKITGIKLLRDFCKNNFKLLNDRQKKIIETNFSYILCKFYLKNNLINELKKEMNKLKRKNLIKWLNLNLYIIIRKVKIHLN